MHQNYLHGNSGVRFPNHYTRAKLEKALPITSRDINRFINIRHEIPNLHVLQKIDKCEAKAR